MAYLSSRFIKMLAEGLQVQSIGNEKMGYHKYLIGSKKLDEKSVRFRLMQWEEGLDCTLVIFGDEDKKRKIIETLVDEFSFDYPENLPQFFRRSIVIGNEHYIVDVYIWVTDLKEANRRLLVEFKKMNERYDL